jgi:hypothetical protein
MIAPVVRTAITEFGWTVAHANERFKWGFNRWERTRIFNELEASVQEAKMIYYDLYTHAVQNNWPRAEDLNPKNNAYE